MFWPRLKIVKIELADELRLKLPAEGVGETQMLKVVLPPTLS